MSSPPDSARDRMVIGAADMIRRRGLNATSVRVLAKHTGAPLGSTYHYFPGGKQQLATEAVQWAGAAITGMLERALEHGPVEGLRAFVALWRGTIVRSDFRAGCPVLAVAVEEPDDQETAAIAAADAAFAAWEATLAASLNEHGVDLDRAARLAMMVVASIEGTVAICRARRSAEPLDVVAGELELMLAAALAQP